MTLPVYLVDDPPGRVGATVRVEGEEARHAVVVRRTRVGAQVLLGDGRGRRATCEVVSTGKASLEARVLSVDDVPVETPRVTVVQALPKGDRGELAVEVLTEVGVDVVVPWAAERCVAVWKGERATKGLARWRSTAREAGKQARRAWLPEVAPLATTDDVVTRVADADLALVLHEDADLPLGGLDLAGVGSVLLVVGPEGGLTDAEVDRLRDAGALVVRLGSAVLRTSTAGVVAVGAVLARTRWR